MSGLIRNLMTLLLAFLNRNSAEVQSKVKSTFVTTPFDCGISVLKSDKYFQLAESAQIDYLVKTKLLSHLLTKRISFVNASQLIKFVKPIRMFKQVHVESQIVIADDKCAYFSHVFYSSGKLCSEVLVKMKFKKNALTVNPREILGQVEFADERKFEDWNNALDQMP